MPYPGQSAEAAQRGLLPEEEQNTSLVRQQDTKVDDGKVTRSPEVDGDNTGEKRQPIEGSQEAVREALKDPNSPEFKLLEQLKQRDREVRTHEQAHLNAAGQYARGGPYYEYEKGPDGKRYAVGGHVNIDTSRVAGNPEATLRKAEVVRRAALAPAEPSPQDRRVAAQATSMAIEARQEINRVQQEEAAAQREAVSEKLKQAVNNKAGNNTAAAPVDNSNNALSKTASTGSLYNTISLSA